MEPPSPLTLIFSPEFGAVHWGPTGFKRDENGDITIFRDSLLAGRTIVFHPQPAQDIPPRTMFELGRHPQCWVKIGWERDPISRKYREKTDDRGFPLMNYFPRITLTFQWMDATEWSWVDESQWYIVPGGVFIGKQSRERSGNNLDVYLNNIRTNIAAGGAQPLFPNGADHVCLAIINRDVHEGHDVPYLGKLIVLNRAIDEHSTGWPKTIWEGAKWPTLEPVDALSSVEIEPETSRQEDLEEAITDAKQSMASPNQPWFAPWIEDWWRWYLTKSTIVQLFILVLISGSASVLFWIWLTYK